MALKGGMNNEVCQIIQGLRLVHKSITLGELIELESPSAEFEAHVASDVGKDFWIYSINDNGRRFLLDGDAIVVRASKFLPDVAETIAQQGLFETILSAKRYDANTGLHATVEIRGAQ